MQRSEPKKLFPYSFWISLLLHILILVTLVLLYIYRPKDTQEFQAAPSEAIPAYTYTPKSAPATPVSAPQAQKQNQKSKPIEKPEQAEREVKQSSPITAVTKSRSRFSKQNKARPRSMFAASMAMLQQTQLNALSAPRDEEPVYIVGDQNGVADPLIQLLGKALSAHFSYPKTAGELGIRGRVLIGMTLHPDGQLSDIEMVSSSNSEELDAAALYAVNSAPVVEYVDRFISRPKHFVIGFIFR